MLLHTEKIHSISTTSHLQFRYLTFTQLETYALHGIY